MMEWYVFMMVSTLTKEELRSTVIINGVLSALMLDIGGLMDKLYVISWDITMSMTSIHCPCKPVVT